MPLLKLKYKAASNPCATGYFPIPPSIVEYIGRPVPLKFLSENEFALTTGDMDSPVRILDKSSIIKAWVSNRKDNVTIVEGKYVVTAGPFNRYSCTCTAYNYRKRCSHIDGVKRG